MQSTNRSDLACLFTVAPPLALRCTHNLILAISFSLTHILRVGILVFTFVSIDFDSSKHGDWEVFEHRVHKIYLSYMISMIFFRSCYLDSDFGAWGACGRIWRLDTWTSELNQPDFDLFSLVWTWSKNFINPNQTKSVRICFTLKTEPTRPHYTPKCRHQQRRW